MYDIIQREEPERWRRHIVKRHVVSEIPQPEIEVEEMDTEAPKDDCGFPSLPSRLSKCGGARAPHGEVDGQGQPNGLINELLGVDLVEA